MTMPLDPEKARQLLDRGMLNQDTYDRNFGAAPQAPAALVQDPEMLFRDKAGDIKKMEIDQQRADLNKRADMLKKLNVPEEQIQSRLEPILSDLDSQERGLILTGEKQPEASQDVLLTTDMPAQTQIDPRDQIPSNMLTAGIDLQQKAVGMAAQAGMAKAAENVAAMEQTQKGIAEMRAADEQFRIEQQQKIADEQAKLNDEVNRVSQLKVDQGRFWSDRTTADKIVLGASLFLGAFGAAQTGVNQAARVIDAAIDRDIKLQQGDIAQQTRGVQQRRGVLADMRSQFKDEMQARAATKVAYLQDAQLKIQEIASKYEGPQAQARAMQLIGQLEVQKQQANAQFMASYMKNQPVTPDANIALLSKDQRERFVPGYGLALTKEAAVKGRELAGTIANIKGNIDELLALSDKSLSSVSPTDRARANTISSILIGQLRLPIVGPGAVTEKELDLLRTIIADPTRIMSLDATNKERLKTLRERMDTQTSNQLETLGLMSPETKIGFKPLK